MEVIDGRQLEKTYGGGDFVSIVHRSVTMLAAVLFTQFFLMLVSAVSIAADAPSMPPPEPYCQWEAKNFSIEQPLCGLAGDPARGKDIISRGDKGNCVACHTFPIEEVEAYGTIGPPLAGLGARLSKGFIRLRVVDTKQINPVSIMPGFYRDPALINRPAKEVVGRTFLTAQQIEDVIAYLVTLK